MWVVFVLLAVASCFVAFKLRKRIKSLSPLGTITVCTGAVKTGKSSLAVYLAIKSYKKALRAWRFSSMFKNVEQPLLYSNIPLACEYVPVTTDILLRKQRIVPKSVMLLDEASLVADSQLIKDNQINLNLLAFFKLFGHSSHGGTLILDTQSISDLHYSCKRTLQNYIYIYKTRSLPFFLVMDVLEQRYSDDGTVISAQNSDITENLKHVIVPKSVWKKFDCYTYSVLTDNLPIANKKVVPKTLKSTNIPSFRDWSHTIPVEEKKNDKK